MHKHQQWLGLSIVLAMVFSVSTTKADNEYMVEKGDTLYSIGKLLGVPWKQIMNTNNLKSSQIFPDQILLIPSAGKTVEQDLYATATQSKPIPSIIATPAPEIPAFSKPSTVKVTYRAENLPGMAYIPSIQGRSKSRPELSAPMAKHDTYIVQAGDSVWSISRKFGVSAWDLRKANNINYSSIQVGQILRMPSKSSAVSIAAY